MSLRLITGGRGEGATNGLIVHGASAVVTMAGGLRRGAAQADAAVLEGSEAGGPNGADGPVVACWDGRIVAVGTRSRYRACHSSASRVSMPMAAR